MLNQILKFTLVSSLLLWLRPRWRSLLSLVTLVILVHVLHAEYLGYVELSGDQEHLVWSYVVKWLVLLVGIGIYLFYTLSVGGTDGNGARSVASTPPAEGSAPKGDGFDFLRQKKQLQNKAEKVIQSKGSAN